MNDRNREIIRARSMWESLRRKGGQRRTESAGNGVRLCEPSSSGHALPERVPFSFFADGGPNRTDSTVICPLQAKPLSFSTASDVGPVQARLDYRAAISDFAQLKSHALTLRIERIAGFLQEWWWGQTWAKACSLQMRAITPARLP